MFFLKDIEKIKKSIIKENNKSVDMSKFDNKRFKQYLDAFFKSRRETK